MASNAKIWVPPIHDVAHEIDPAKVTSARLTAAESAITGGWVGDLGQVLDMLGIGSTP